MTEPIAPHELSGLLDGELNPQRAAEIRLILATDSQIRAEFERLEALDRAWSAAASRAAFRRRLAPAATRGTTMPPGVASALGLVLLVGVRFLPKVTSAFVPGVAVHLVVLAGVIAGLVWLHGRINDPASGPTSSRELEELEGQIP